MKKLGEAFGALTLVGGLTWVLLNLHGPSQVLDVVVGLVLALGGLVLLMPHRFRLPGRLTAGVAAVAALGGTAAGVVHGTGTLGGLYVYLEQRGWPFLWVARGGFAGDEATARRLAATGSWQPDLLSLAADLLIYAYAGMLVVAVVVLIRRRPAGRDAPRVPSAAR